MLLTTFFVITFPLNATAQTQRSENDNQVNQAARSWSQFRGDQRDGSVEGLPTRSLDIELQWEFPLPANGVGGVAATDEMVVVSSRNGNDTADLFFILDPADGGIIYKHEVATQGRLDYGNSPRATPVIGPELVYVLNAFGQLVAIDPTEGQVRWQKHLIDTLGGRMPTWGFCASPLLAGDTLIVQPGGTGAQVVALNAGDGQVKWKTSGTKRAAYASPMLLPARDASPSFVLGCDESGLVAWSLSGGEEIWRIQPKARGEFMVPSPLVIERTLYWIGETNGLRAFRLGAPGSTSTPSLIAENDEVLSDTHSPAVVSHAVVTIADDKTLVALDPEYELRVLDRFEHPALDGYAAIMTEDDRALVCCANGTLILLKLDAGKWTKLDEKQPRRLTSNILAHPAFVDGKLYSRGDRSLSCYQLK